MVELAATAATAAAATLDPPATAAALECCGGTFGMLDAPAPCTPAALTPAAPWIDVVAAEAAPRVMGEPEAEVTTALAPAAEAPGMGTIRPVFTLAMPDCCPCGGWEDDDWAWPRREEVGVPCAPAPAGCSWGCEVGGPPGRLMYGELPDMLVELQMSLLCL